MKKRSPEELKKKPSPEEEEDIRRRTETYILEIRGKYYLVEVEFKPDFDKMKLPQWMIDMLLKEIRKMPDDPEELDRYIARHEEERKKTTPKYWKVEKPSVVQPAK